MKDDLQLSKHFKLSEFLKSQTALRFNFQEQFNPPQEVIENIQSLVDNLLQPLRYTLPQDGMIRINSGYRCPRLNEAVGGKPTSQHQRGEAADCEYYENGIVDNLKLFKHILEFKSTFDQMIKEFGTENQPAWIHISFTTKRKNRMEVLTI